MPTYVSIEARKKEESKVIPPKIWEDFHKGNRLAQSRPAVSCRSPEWVRPGERGRNSNRQCGGSSMAARPTPVPEGRQIMAQDVSRG